jgi:beta-glucanase (GH16 family)
VIYYTYTFSPNNNSEQIFTNPFFFLLNVAVGGNWPGYPDNTTTFPAEMEVDYVRVYTDEISNVNEESTSSFNVYPNPNHGTFTVQMAQGLEQVRVMNSVGQVVNMFNAQSAKQFEVAMNLPTGLYFVEVTSNGRKLTQRVIVE